jgi:hypothetical protein
MEAEFVNEYIARLNSTIHDLIGKNIMLETRLVIAERVISTLQQELDQLKSAEPTANLD